MEKHSSDTDPAPTWTQLQSWFPDPDLKLILILTPQSNSSLTQILTPVLVLTKPDCDSKMQKKSKLCFRLEALWKKLCEKDSSWEAQTTQSGQIHKFLVLEAQKSFIQVWKTVKRLWSTDYETNLLSGTDSGAEKHILYVFIE